MRGVFALCACVLLSTDAVLAGIVQSNEAGPEEMGVPSGPQPAGLFTNEAAGDGLINGDLASDVPEQQLVPGPKVNGGFAVNVQPKKKKTDTRRVSNADCAGGHFVDGKCLRPFPKSSRTATIKDNMLSPEQANDQHLYEADIHSFVLKHFGQKVMQNTPEEEHHDMFPGHDLMMYEMNKNGNDHADSISESLVPIGTDLMTSMDGEVDVDLSQGMTSPSRRHRPRHAAMGDAAEDKPAPCKLTEGSEEIAEPVDVVEGVEEEQGDLQSQVPSVPVAEEPGLPPTPTPTPTPNLEEMQRKKEEAEARAQQTQTCLDFLADQDITCSGTSEEKEQMGERVGSMANVQVATASAPLFVEGNSKLNFESMVVHCTTLASTAMSNALSNPASSNSERAQFAQQLQKYSAAMTCAASENYPACVPEELASVVQNAKSATDYTCV